MRHAVAAFLVVLGSVAVLPAGTDGRQSDPGGQLVFLIRHAERADAGMASAKTPGADPELSEAGKARAKALVGVLKDAQITSIFVTQYKRTRDTGQPLADAIGIPTVTIDATDGRLIQTIKAATGNVLVVGHSNTVPEVIKALGVADPMTIAEEEFDNLFVVVRGAKPSLLRLHY